MRAGSGARGLWQRAVTPCHAARGLPLAGKANKPLMRGCRCSQQHGRGPLPEAVSARLPSACSEHAQGAQCEVRANQDPNIFWLLLLVPSHCESACLGTAVSLGKASVFPKTQGWLKTSQF